MLTLSLILLLAAFGTTLYHAVKGQPPLWIAVLFLCLALLLRSIPA